jgi:ribosomal protein S4
MNKYPKGLFYDRTKKRWRARVYVKGVIVSNSYWPTMEDAEKGYKENLEKFLARRLDNPVSTLGMLQTLRRNYA